MLHQKLITIGKLKQAYSLTTYNAEDLLEALLPDKVFPYALWQLTYDKFWAEAIRSATVRYSVSAPLLPIADNLPEQHYPYSMHTHNIEQFFAKLLRTIKSSELKTGINYIMENTYDGESPHKLEIDSFFLALSQNDWSQRNRTSGYLEIESAEVSYSFVSASFSDTIVVNKKAAILWLESLGALRDKEVVGITTGIVDSIINSAKPTPIVNVASEIPLLPASKLLAKENPSEPAPTDTLKIPRSLWEHKTPRAACKNMMNEDFAPNIIALVLSSRCNQNGAEISRLLNTYPKKVATYLKETAHLSIVDS